METPAGFREDLGMWVALAAQALPASLPRPALFLDRDGVIVEEPGYLHRAADMVLIPGAVEVIATANRNRVPVVEITNQAGIGRGYYGWKEFLEVEAAMTAGLARGGAVIDGVFACPYHRDGVAPWNLKAHPARKPRPGMLLAAAQFLNLDLARSWVVGDKMGDVLAGYNAGLRGGLHVLTGEGPQHRCDALTWDRQDFELRIGDSILDALPLVELLARS